MFTFENFIQLNKSREWTDSEMEKNYAIAIRVANIYYETYGKTKVPKIADIVEYADDFHVYYNAKIVENLCFVDDTKVCICENGSSHTNGKYFSTSGGAFHSINKSSLQYVGETENIVWTWGCNGPGAFQGIYIPLKVNKWIIPYDNNAVKRSQIYLTENDTVNIMNNDSWGFYVHTFKSKRAFEAWAKYVGYNYTIEGKKGYSPQKIENRCWTSNDNKPNGKPIKVLANGKVRDGLVTTEEFCITEWWENIYKPEQPEPKYGTYEYNQELKKYNKYHNNPMGV